MQNPLKKNKALPTRFLPKGMDRIVENKTGRPFYIPDVTRAGQAKEFFQRLEQGAGKSCLFLPSLGEFGHRIMTGIRLVHWHKASDKVVCCHPGEQVLYPSASRFVTNWKDVDDSTRGGTGNALSWPSIEALFPNHIPIQVGNLTTYQETLCINPEQRIPFQPIKRGLQVDVCLGIRHRQFCPEKNWPYWEVLARAIVNNGFSFAVLGRRPTTLDLPNQKYNSADSDTDATIELLQNCQVYLGTDTGISHLAATIGAEMIVWREESPWNRDLRQCMVERNPGKVELMPSSTWTNPKNVIQSFLARNLRPAL